MFKINCHQIVRYFGDACQSPKRERSGLRDRTPARSIVSVNFEQLLNAELADTALVGKAVAEIYAKRYPAAYSTRWLQGWLAGCNTKVGGDYFDFTAPDLAGNDHTLSKEIAGRVALIDLWGSWCASCRKHSKELIPLYDKYKDRGFTVVGVAREYDNADAMKTAIRRDGYPWLNLLELDDRLGIWTRYGIGNAGGGRFLVGRDGKILAINPDAAQVEAI